MRPIHILDECIVCLFLLSSMASSYMVYKGKKHIEWLYTTADHMPQDWIDGAVAKAEHYNNTNLFYSAVSLGLALLFWWAMP